MPTQPSFRRWWGRSFGTRKDKCEEHIRNVHKAFTDAKAMEYGSLYGSRETSPDSTQGFQSGASAQRTKRPASTPALRPYVPSKKKRNFLGPESSSKDAYDSLNLNEDSFGNDFADVSSQGTSLCIDEWHKLLPSLAESIRDDIELQQVNGSGLVWTCTPSRATPEHDIPLTIAGRPVVVPTESLYPPSALTISPPDPHRHQLIDASTQIDDVIINEIFKVYPDALGFYLLINGMLQLIVPEDYDLQFALSHQPNEFGGLKVSHIVQSVVPTYHSPDEHEEFQTYGYFGGQSTRSRTLLQETPIMTESVSLNKRGPDLNQSGNADKANAVSDMMDLKIGSMVEARVDGAKLKNAYQGKIGIRTASHDGCSQFLVVSSHVLTQALSAAKSNTFPGANWHRSVKVVASNGGREVQGVLRSP
jgi:hypothetical protein